MAIFRKDSKGGFDAEKDDHLRKGTGWSSLGWSSLGDSASKGSALEEFGCTTHHKVSLGKISLTEMGTKLANLPSRR